MSRAWTPQSFFAGFHEPEGLHERTRQVEAFLHRHGANGRKVVLVTSGGTTVPLEKNVVRFLDNFSAGTRGAASAEYFLKHGYAVIFMSRQHSQFPFTRSYSHTTNPLFDLLEEPGANGGSVRVCEDQVGRLLPILHAYHDAKKHGLLLTVPFVTVIEYLFLLRNISLAMASIGRQAMLYLAAAVSDFFMPEDRISEHKIQSSDHTLTIELEQVPKVLGVLVQEWLPEAYIVSFKLETDDNLLVPKSERSLRNYGHQLVIGNHLHRRKWEVVLVEQTARARTRTTDMAQPFEHTWIRLPPETEREIEQDIVQALAQRHMGWIGVA